MDSEAITGNNSHFAQVTCTEDDITKSIQYKARRDVGPIKYFYIDVGISIQYSSLALSHDRAISGLWGQDKTLAEFRRSFSSPVDPFMTDICHLGSVFARIVQVSRYALYRSFFSKSQIAIRRPVSPGTYNHPNDITSAGTQTNIPRGLYAAS